MDRIIVTITSMTTPYGSICVMKGEGGETVLSIPERGGYKNYGPLTKEQENAISLIKNLKLTV